MKRLFRYTVSAVALFAVSASPQSPKPAAAPEDLVRTYCVGCHNGRLRTAGLALDELDPASVASRAEDWEKVLEKLRTGTMPPPGMPKPDKASVTAFLSVIASRLDSAAQAHPNPGRVPVHRLNQAEYANAIRDLLALEIDPKSLLAEDDVSKQGFNNTAGVLSVSPALLERYMSAARKISRLAIGDPSIVPGFEVYPVPKLLVQDERGGEDLPFGTRGGIAVHHHFPLDAEYVVKIRLRRQLYSYILGLGRPHQMEVRLDGKRVGVLTVGGEAPGKPAPASYVGNIVGDPEWERYMHFADDALEIRFPARAGTRVVSVSFVEQTPEPEGVRQPDQVGFGEIVNEKYDGNPAVENVAIGGPYKPEGPGDTESRRRIFICNPIGANDERSCAKTILANLARRAWRRPVTDEDVGALLGFYDSGHKHGSFEAGIQAALERLLTDPEFLFRLEPDPVDARPGGVYRLGGIALASRLSFFLWSGIPDDELLDLAASGGLKDPKILDRQVRRMLADGRSKALVDNFAAQWLHLPKLRAVAPLPQLFPDFDENLRDSFERETKLFIENQLAEDRSIVDMLGADYTFLDQRLARHYGVPDIYGDRFRKVTFSDGQRGGLLGQGSILTVTSYANRTSPVIRGKWLLDVILGAAPPPPPAEVPALPENTPGSKSASLRQLVEEHRKNPACASCHTRMDPLGFALENFDAIGKWRNASEGAPIDASGILPDGTTFTGVPGLRKWLLNNREQFVETFTEKLLTYALGRDLGYYDFPAIRKITREAAKKDYRWSSIISGIVGSSPFQMSIARSSQITPGGQHNADYEKSH